MPGGQLRVVAKHASDVKTAQEVNTKEAPVSSTNVKSKPAVAAARKGTPDPLRRTFLERQFQKNRSSGLNEWCTAAETAARKKAAVETTHENAVQKAKAQSGATMPSKADEKDHPLWNPHLPDASIPWPDSDVKNMAEMPEERLVGIATALMLMDQSSALNTMALCSKWIRLGSALPPPPTSATTATATSAASSATVPATPTVSALYEFNPGLWMRAVAYRGKLIPASKTDYSVVHRQNRWTETLVEAMKQLKTLFKLSLSTGDREYLLERTLIRQGKSVPSSVALIIEEFLCKRVAKNTPGNTRLAAAGLLVALWHAELERAFACPVSFLNMIA